MNIVNTKEALKALAVETDEDYYTFHYGFKINLTKKDYEEYSLHDLIQKLNKIVIRQCDSAKRKALFITVI